MMACHRNHWNDSLQCPHIDVEDTIPTTALCWCVMIDDGVLQPPTFTIGFGNFNPRVFHHHHPWPRPSGPTPKSALLNMPVAMCKHQSVWVGTTLFADSVWVAIDARPGKNGAMSHVQGPLTRKRPEWLSPFCNGGSCGWGSHGDWTERECIRPASFCSPYISRLMIICVLGGGLCRTLLEHAKQSGGNGGWWTKLLRPQTHYPFEKIIRQWLLSSGLGRSVQGGWCGPLEPTLPSGWIMFYSRWGWWPGCGFDLIWFFDLGIPWQLQQRPWLKTREKLTSQSGNL